MKDDGLGIERDRLAEVFTIFRRLHPMDSARGGAGVGLSIAQKLVHRHRGSIDIESVAGVGSTFGITLPVA